MSDASEWQPGDWVACFDPTEGAVTDMARLSHQDAERPTWWWVCGEVEEYIDAGVGGWWHKLTPENAVELLFGATSEPADTPEETEAHLLSLERQLGHPPGSMKRPSEPADTPEAT